MNAFRGRRQLGARTGPAAGRDDLPRHSSAARGAAPPSVRHVLLGLRAVAASCRNDCEAFAVGLVHHLGEASDAKALRMASSRRKTYGSSSDRAEALLAGGSWKDGHEDREEPLPHARRAPAPHAGARGDRGELQVDRRKKRMARGIVEAGRARDEVLPATRALPRNQAPSILARRGVENRYRRPRSLLSAARGRPRGWPMVMTTGGSRRGDLHVARGGHRHAGPSCRSANSPRALRSARRGRR